MIDPLIEECSEIINETKIINKNENENENDHKHKYNFFRVFILLFSIIFIINIGIGIYFVCHKYVIQNNNKYDLPY